MIKYIALKNFLEMKFWRR